MCENTNKAYKDAIEYLKTSPMFNLSLSSNELFHSNFLYWIWQVNKECFKKIINSLIGEDNYWQANWGNKTLEVRREYKNFDLSIVEVSDSAKKEEGSDNKVDKSTSESENDSEIGDYKADGLILFVLENKVKSIPYKEQLEQYSDKIEKHNESILKKQIKEKYRASGQANDKSHWKKDWNKELGDYKITPKKILLSLVQTFPDSDKVDDWKIFSYAGYIEIIKTLKLDRFQDIMDDYYNYVRHLLYLNDAWNDDSLTWSGKLLSWTENFESGNNTQNYHFSDATTLRLHAMYLKQKYAKLCKQLTDELRTKFENVQYIRPQDDKILYTGNKPRGHKGKFQSYDDYFTSGESEFEYLIGVGYGYMHAEPFIEVKIVERGKKYFYIIQVQGGSYSHGIIGQTTICNHEFVDNWMRKIKPGDVDEKAYNNSSEILSGDIFIKENNILYPEHSTNRQYRHYGENMIYQLRILKTDVETTDLINYMVNDVEKLLKGLNNQQ